MADITMPQLGETVTEGTITKWRKAVGEEVKEDEVLFEVSTDKVDSEVPSPVSGVLTQVLASEGDTVAVGSVIAVVEAGGAGAAPAPAAAAAPEPAPAPAPAPVAETPPPVVETPPPAPVAAAPTPAPAATNGTQTFDNAGKVLSPVVRKLIKQHNLNPATIQGTGAGGRITRRDVEALVGGAQPQAATTAPAPTRPAPAASPVAAPAPAVTAPDGVVRAQPIVAPGPSKGDTVIPFTNIRRRTAEHMIRSKATSAHTLVVIDVDYYNVDKARIPAKSQFKAEEGVNLTYLPFVARAVCDALREFPNLNSSVGADDLIIHGDVNLGFAVDMNFEGLIVPVVRQADTKRLRALAREVADLADRARGKQLGSDEIANGTFTITNAGGYGTFVTYPVISQPQVGILSTDGVKKRPIVVELPDGSDAIAIHPVGNLALAWDHRAVDGAYAAAFMARVKEILETRNWAEEI